MPPRSPFPVIGTNADSRAALLQGLLIGAIVAAALHFGRDLLLPLTFAILLSFVLSPPLLLLRRLRVPRVLSVLVVVIFAFAIIGSLEIGDLGVPHLSGHDVAEDEAAIE